ncbi:MAG: methyltransferase domain-containing protein [Chloroflexia bacterium]
MLDLMSSWVSHLPPDVRYSRVAGVGLNAVELEHNARLDERVVQDLNLDPVLPFEDAAFDAAVCCVSIQYLVRPVEVLRDVRRVVKTGGPLVVAYSNRCFPTKAVAVWQMLDDVGHGRLIEAYLLGGGWSTSRCWTARPRGGAPTLSTPSSPEPPRTQPLRPNAAPSLTSDDYERRRLRRTFTPQQRRAPRVFVGLGSRSALCPLLVPDDDF